jgi:hypothetical protein
MPISLVGLELVVRSFDASHLVVGKTDWELACPILKSRFEESV